MIESMAPQSPPLVRPIRKEILVKGRPTEVPCLEVGGQVFAVNRGLVSVATLEDEWYEDLQNPVDVIESFKRLNGSRPDILSFWQRLPEVEPKHRYHLEWEEIAALPIQTHEHWWNHQIKPRVRNLIRKAEKEGVEVRETAYDDEFVRGMTAIFNEAPVRQGRRFWHYGKDFETVKRQFSRYVFREQMIAAYCQGEMIGFIMLGDAGRFGLTGQIISSLKHRDKATNNALISKAVEIAERKGWAHLVYFFWSNDSLAEFKRRCGFQRTAMPRYYVPLTARGRLGLQIGAHRGIKNMLPERIRGPLKRLRKLWLDRQERRTAGEG